ncbi:MAG: hypothetical protein RSF67_08440, partial [Clostridia bacterium]
KNKKEYSFKSNFVPHLEPGDICSIKINDIDTLIQISTIEHTLSRVNGFYSEIVALEYEKIEQEFNYSKIESLSAKDSFLGTLNNIKDKVDETDKKLEEVILIEGARGFVSETDPSLEREIKEPDVWFNPTTKEFKVWRNGKWNPAREEDIPPALMTALKAQAGIFRIGGNDTEAGIFFQYDKDKKNPVFGATDPENLAQVSIDKEANVLIRNANNKLAFNMRNPENPSEIISQLLMGVYNADDTERHKNTLFQVGDESTGSYIKFERGKLTNVIDGKDIGETVNNIEKGNLTINTNTTFDGKATFISAGSNETTIIRDGSISFTRNGQTITTIRNMRSGSIATDGNGNGYVDFTGMKNNLIILPSIKGFNVSANVRSINCRVEKDPNYLAQNRYKFFVYGTEEVYEGQIKVTNSTNGYTMNAYSAGIEQVTLNSTSLSYTDTIPGSVTGPDCNGISNARIRDCKLGIKVYISENGAEKYFGETELVIENRVGTNLFIERQDYSRLTLRYRIPNIEIRLVNYTCTTQNKNNKRVRVELVIKERPICKIYSYEYYTDDGGHTQYRYNYKNSEIPINSNHLNFVNGTYYYSPSYIQNIVGGGEVQYLAIEQ